MKPMGHNVSFPLVNGGPLVGPGGYSHSEKQQYENEDHYYANNVESEKKVYSLMYLYLETL